MHESAKKEKEKEKEKEMEMEDKPYEEQELQKLYAEAQPFGELQQEASPDLPNASMTCEDEDVLCYCKRCDTLVTHIRYLMHPVLDRCSREPSEYAALRTWKRLKKEDRKERAAELNKRSRNAKKIDSETALLMGFTKCIKKTSTSHETRGDRDESVSGDEHVVSLLSIYVNFFYWELICLCYLEGTETLKWDLLL